MTRGKLLVGAALLAGAGICVSGASPAATIAGGFLRAGGLPFAADEELADAAILGEWFQAPPLATRIPGIGDEGVIGGPGVDHLDAAENKRAIAFPAPGLTSGSAEDLDGEPVGMRSPGLEVAGMRSPGLEVAGMLSPPEDARTVSSGVSAGLIGDLVAPVNDTNQATPSSVGSGDILVEDAVPALAAFGLLAAGFLLLGLVRRHRRAVVARRLKRRFGGPGARAARGQNRP